MKNSGIWTKYALKVKKTKKKQNEKQKSRKRLFKKPASTTIESIWHDVLISHFDSLLFTRS